MSLPIVIDFIRCSTQVYLADCQFSTRPSSSCTHNSDVGVHCRDSESLSNNDVCFCIYLNRSVYHCLSVSTIFARV